MMSEQDFVMAWLLAMRAGSSEAMFGDTRIANNIHQAREIYKKLTEETNETNG
jgi:hypothetical protein